MPIWKEYLKLEAIEKNITLTMYMKNIFCDTVKDIFDTLITGNTINKIACRNSLPDKVYLVDFIKLCLCIKSPYDYNNLYLFDLIGYPKDKYNAFILGKVFKFKGIKIIQSYVVKLMRIVILFVSLIL